MVDLARCVPTAVARKGVYSARVIAAGREVLAKIVPAFKQQLGELIQSGAAIPWIDPPREPDPKDQTRLIPVHL